MFPRVPGLVIPRGVPLGSRGVNGESEKRALVIGASGGYRSAVWELEARGWRFRGRCVPATRRTHQASSVEQWARRVQGASNLVLSLHGGALVIDARSQNDQASPRSAHRPVCASTPSARSFPESTASTIFPKGPPGHLRRAFSPRTARQNQRQTARRLASTAPRRPA